jgi:hypothetical protein
LARRRLFGWKVRFGMEPQLYNMWDRRFRLVCSV